VFFSITAIAVGGVVFHDFQNMPYNNIGFFACGVALCIAGVLVINSGRDAPSLPLGGPGDPAADGADSEGDGQTVAVSAEGGASEATKLLSGGSRGSSSEEAGYVSFVYFSCSCYPASSPCLRFPSEREVSLRFLSLADFAGFSLLCSR